jgi:hypothetical protein
MSSFCECGFVMESRVFYMLGKSSNSELHVQPSHVIDLKSAGVLEKFATEAQSVACLKRRTVSFPR